MNEAFEQQKKHDDNTTIIRPPSLTRPSPQHPNNPRIVVINTQLLVTEHISHTVPRLNAHFGRILRAAILRDYSWPEAQCRQRLL